MKNERAIYNKRFLLFIVKSSPLILFSIQLLLMSLFSSTKMLIGILLIFSIIIYLLISQFIKNTLDEVKHFKAYVDGEESFNNTNLEKMKNSYLFPLVSSICELKNGYNKTLETINVDIRTVSMCTDSLDMISSEIANNCKDFVESENKINNSVIENNKNIKNVSESTIDLNENVISIASAIEELSSSIDEIVHSCAAEFKIANDASGISKTVNDKMQKLREFTSEIAKVLSVIGDISDRTNLLALNATIEAASAGDAGKGFAVVANEVKDLARQTNTAANEIEEKIREMEASTDEAVLLVEKISAVNDEMNNISQTISVTVEEQSNVISEISKKTANTSKTVSDISKSIEQVSQASESITSNMINLKDASNKSLEQMQNISGSVEMLKQIIDGLKTKVK